VRKKEKNVGFVCLVANALPNKVFGNEMTIFCDAVTNAQNDFI